MMFRRFVLGFYTPAFRDLFFSAEPPKHLFRAVVTVFAGHWRPSWVTRCWIALFFLSVRLQAWLGFEPSYSESLGVDSGHNQSSSPATVASHLHSSSRTQQRVKDGGTT